MKKTLFMTTFILVILSFLPSVDAAKPRFSDQETMKKQLSEVIPDPDFIERYSPPILVHADREISCEAEVVLMFTHANEAYISKYLTGESLDERHQMKKLLNELVPKFIAAILPPDLDFIEQVISEFKSITQNN